jgi:YVTN family beta-propeller protein
MKKASAILATLLAGTTLAGTAQAGSYTFTTTPQFDLGIYNSTNATVPPDQVQLDPNVVTRFDFIWVALSGRGSIARIDVNYNDLDDGVADTMNFAAVKGEYYSAPQGQPANPSRTTVDLDGNVWVANRDQGDGGLGSMTKVSASATGAATSTGVWNAATGDPNTFDRRSWNNAGGADTNGGTSTASDPAILQYVRTAGTGLRTVAINANNDVWTGGLGNRAHQLYDGATGAPVASGNPPFNAFNNGNGGYGGVVDGNGVLWSAGFFSLVRHDPATGSTIVVPGINGVSYGLAVDNNGDIWNSNWTNNTIQRISPAGAVLNTYGVPGANALRGVAVTPADNDIWIAGSFSNTVTRLNAATGAVIATINVGGQPTGVAVDSNGKVWVTNLDSDNAQRIDPATNMVDLTVFLGNDADPYNYSDMTGSVVGGITNPTGSWEVIQDSGSTATMWDDILWNTEAEGSIPTGTSITVKARVADTLADLAMAPYMTYDSGDLINMTGRYIQVMSTLTRPGGVGAVSPILSDVTVNFTSEVPEPVSLSLLGLGLAGLFAGAHRRTRPAS